MLIHHSNCTVNLEWRARLGQESQRQLSTVASRLAASETTVLADLHWLEDAVADAGDDATALLEARIRQAEAPGLSVVMPRFRSRTRRPRLACGV